MNRVVAVARMQLAHPLITYGLPAAIVSFSFAINWTIWALGDVAAHAPGDGTTGGVASLYVTVLVFFIQTVAQVFPFAMGLSISRREFYAGTGLTAVLQSAVYGVALTVLAAVENATNGWGVQLHFWAPAPLDVANLLLQFLVLAMPMLACAFIGVGIGAVFTRWGTPGLYALTVGTLVTAGLAAVLAAWQDAWGDLGNWLLDQTATSLAIALPAGLTLVLAALGFLAIRRAVP